MMSIGKMGASSFSHGGEGRGVWAMKIGFVGASD